MNNQFRATKQLVKGILCSPWGLKWSVQGLGMLRTYLSQEVRLHIWDDSVKVYDASPIHDHPWHLTSTVVAGELRQFRYTLAKLGHLGLPHKMATIKCGEGAFAIGDPEEVMLSRGAVESYTECMEYSQTKDELHETLAVNGTVTLVERTFTENRENARVCWPGKGLFISAEPRVATEDEVNRITRNALEKWF